MAQLHRQWNITYPTLTSVMLAALSAISVGHVEAPHLKQVDLEVSIVLEELL